MAEVGSESGEQGTLEILTLQPQTLDPKLSALSLKPSTPSPQPSTLNPEPSPRPSHYHKPETLSHKAGGGFARKAKEGGESGLVSRSASGGQGTPETQPFNLKPETPTLQPQTRNPDPSTSNPKPQTLSPEPEALNSKPSNINPEP